MDIIPAILTSDLKEAEEKIRIAENLTERIQVDVLDGVFAENKTITLEGLAGIETSTSLDIHLMVKEPVSWVEKSVRAHADRIIGQIEMMEAQEEFVNKVIEGNLLVGLAIDLGTPVSEIDEIIIQELDTVLVMAVKAGFQNQEFEEYALDKVKELKEIRDTRELKFRICVDGGVSIENIKSIRDAGADEVVVGSYLFTGDLKENIGKLEEII